MSAENPLAKFTYRYWEKFATDGLLAVRSSLDAVVTDRARQFDMFDERPPKASSIVAVDIAHRLSPSQVNCWLDCQARWMYRYLLGLPDMVGSSLALGRAVHVALAANFRAKLDTHEDLPTETVEDLFADGLMIELQQATLAEDEDLDDLQDTGIASIRTYMEQVAPSIDPAAVELHVEGEIGGVPVHGYVDLIDTQGRIVDIKTAKKKPSGIRPDYRLQVATYAQITPNSNGQARLDTIVKTKTVQLVEQSFEVSEADLKATAKLYPLAQEGMRSGLYTPNRNSMLCSQRYCPYASQCCSDFGGFVL